MKPWAEMGERERDALIATEVMGWVRATWKESHARRAERCWFLRDPSDPNRLPFDEVWEIAPEDFTPYVDYAASVPRYTTSIASAREVWTKMHDDGWDMTLRVLTPGYAATFEWYAPSSNPGKTGFAAVDPRDGNEALAICLAALRAKGVEV